MVAGVPSIVVPPVRMAGPRVSDSTAFWRANAEFYGSNASAFGLATIFSFAEGLMKSTMNDNHRAGLALIADPTSRPEDSLHNIEYFRDQSRGFGAVVRGKFDKERRSYDSQGNPLPTKIETFLDNAEQYWKARQAYEAAIEAEVDARLPDPNWSPFGPRKPRP